MTLRSSRRSLLSAAFGLGVALTLALLIVGSRYLFATPLPVEPAGVLYAVVAWASHMALLAWLPWLCIVLPAVMLIPRRGFVEILGALVSGAVLSLVLLDTLVYGQNRFHFSPMIVAILEPKTLWFGAAYFVIFTAFFFVLARRMREWRVQVPRRIIVIVLIVAGQLGTHCAHIWADANYYTPITSFTTALPLFYPATAKKFIARMGLLNLEKARQMREVAKLDAHAAAGSNLLYPLHELQIDSSIKRPRGIVIIELDAWRADCLSPELTPMLWAFAEKHQNFLEHSSGGNSSRAGNFSLFYGLPGTYWQYFDGQQRPPVLMDLVRSRNSSCAVLAGGPIYRPANMDKSAFARVPNLRMEIRGLDFPWQKDSLITAEFGNFLDTAAPAQPFFAFLYYDCSTASDAPPSWAQRAVPGAARGEDWVKYARAVAYDDSLVGSVLARIESRGLLDSCVLMITADHGQEFVFDKTGFPGHGSAFDKAQTRVPLIVSWPGRPPAQYRHRTSHNDIVATLVKEACGVGNPASDFCSGRSLFEGKSWDWLVVESYHNFGVIQPDRVTVSYPGGYFEVRDSLYRPLGRNTIDRATLLAAMNETGRFFR